MDLFFKLIHYFTIALYVAMTILALTWKPRKGKWLLFGSVSLVLTGSVFVLISQMLINDIDYDSVLFHIIIVLQAVFFLGSHIFLLLYIILLRKPAVVAVGLGAPTENGGTDPAQTEEEKPQALPIGGWLILPSLGLILSPFALIASMIIGFTSFEEVADYGYGWYMSLALFHDFFLLAFVIVAAVFFFQKKKAARPIMISMFTTTLVLSIVIFIAAIATDEDMIMVNAGKELVRSIIISLIWIPYFIVSKRVKATFVK